MAFVGHIVTPVLFEFPFTLKHYWLPSCIETFADPLLATRRLSTAEASMK